MESVTTIPRQIIAAYARVNDEMPLFVGTDLPCGSERIAQRDDDGIRWVRIDSIDYSIDDRDNGRNAAFQYDGGTAKFHWDELVVIRERVHLAD